MKYTKLIILLLFISCKTAIKWDIENEKKCSINLQIPIKS